MHLPDFRDSVARHIQDLLDQSDAILRTRNERLTFAKARFFDEAGLDSDHDPAETVLNDPDPQGNSEHDESQASRP